MKSLKLPLGKQDEIWSLTAKEYFFLDLTLILSLRNSDIYRLVYGGNLTDAQYNTRSSAVATSADAKEYLIIRKKQLENYYFPNDGVEGDQNTEKQKTMSIEESIADMLPDAVVNLRSILRDKNDENYGDVLRVFLTKLIRDMDTKNTASPPLRYLPEVPCLNCKYRIFIEESGEVENCCLQCKYRDYGEKQGIHYDQKNQLDKSLVESK